MGQKNFMTIHFLSAFRIEVRVLRQSHFFKAITNLYSTNCITDKDPTIIMSKETVEEFPVWALQPRIETGATAFLNKFPTFDGRGTVIAIFDSGVDPGAGGLQVTSDGKPKVIERIDASGAGDVDMSKTAEVSEDFKLTGVTGKTLVVPSEWCQS